MDPSSIRHAFAPMDAVMALSDAAHDKAQRRKLNNRRHARESREREKQYVQGLIRTIDNLKAEIAVLKNQKDSLQVDNTALSSASPQPGQEACNAALQPKIYIFTESFLFGGLDN